MAKWYRALAALPEDLNSIPSTHIRQPTTAYNSSFSRSDTLWPQWLPAHTQVTCKLRQAHIYT